MNKNQEVKKVSPYPIDVRVPLEGKILVFQILQLTERGFIADTSEVVLKLASTIADSSFILPLTGQMVSAPLRVVRNYDRPILNSDKTISIQRLTEFHFQKLSNEQRKKIQDFLIQTRRTTI